MGGLYANLTVMNVMQDQTLSPLVSDMRYDVYAEATNIAGSTKSKVIAAITRQEGKKVELCKDSKTHNILNRSA